MHNSCSFSETKRDPDGFAHWLSGAVDGDVWGAKQPFFQGSEATLFSGGAKQPFFQGSEATLFSLGIFLLRFHNLTLTSLNCSVI